MKEMTRYPFLLWSAVAVIFLTLLVALLPAAPIPRSKPKQPRPEINGPYTMHWGGTLYPALFIVGGDYACQSMNNPPTQWEGKWELKGDKLTITERMVYPTGERGGWCAYHFVLYKDRLQSDNYSFKLVPLTEGK